MPCVHFVEESKRVRQLDASSLIGSAQLSSLVTFPSVHTALAYGILMIAATPIWGGHYLVDLIAGAAMAIGAVWLVERFSSAEPRAGSEGAVA